MQPKREEERPASLFDLCHIPTQSRFDLHLLGRPLGFGEADTGSGALLSFPLMIVAQARLVLLHLRF
jgi:hypothetical protein